MNKYPWLCENASQMNEAGRADAQISDRCFRRLFLMAGRDTVDLLRLQLFNKLDSSRSRGYRVKDRQETRSFADIPGHSRHEK